MSGRISVVERKTPVIKICGLRDADLVRIATEAGATAIGFMLAESRRRVTPAEVAAIREQTSNLDIRRVGVTVNESASTLKSLRDIARLDALQLSGDEDPSILDELDGPAWKALRFEPGTTLEEASRAIEPWFDHARPVEALLVDAYVLGMYGGSGHRADWELARRLSERYPVVLAGGLSPENVSSAVEQSTPLGVDVSSGVETDQRKDPDKVRRFVAGARAALGLPDHISSIG